MMVKSNNHKLTSKMSAFLFVFYTLILLCPQLLERYDLTIESL